MDPSRLSVEHEPAADFASDNMAGASPEVIEAISSCVTCQSAPYGADDCTLRAERRLSAQVNAYLQGEPDAAQQDAGLFQPQAHQPSVRRDARCPLESSNELEAAHAAKPGQVFKSDPLGQPRSAVLLDPLQIWRGQATLNARRGPAPCPCEELLDEQQQLHVLEQL